MLSLRQLHVLTGSSYINHRDSLVLAVAAALPLHQPNRIGIWPVVLEEDRFVELHWLLMHRRIRGNILNFQESKKILNACTKKSGNLFNGSCKSHKLAFVEV